MAITNYDGIIAARGAGKGDDRFCVKSSNAWTAGVWYIHTMVGGNMGSATYIAASVGGAVMSDTMAGATPMSSATAGDSKYLLSWGAGAVAGPEAGAFALIDLLWAGSSFVLTASGTIAINSPTLSRSSLGVNNQLGVMIRTAVTTANTMTILYTDAGGTATSVNVTIPVGTSGRMSPTGYLAVPIPNGIRSIQSANAQSAQTAGVVDLMIFKVLDVIPAIGQYTWVEKDMTAQIDGLVKLDLDSSYNPGFLTPVVLGAGTTGRPFCYMVKTCAG